MTVPATNRWPPVSQALALCAVLGLALSGCSGAGELPSNALVSDANASSPKAAVAVGPAAGYALNEEEKSLDCSRLTGRMKIRIMALKDTVVRERTSGLSRTMQTAANSAVGGSSIGADPTAEESRDRAMLEAYNTQLAAKGCKTLDLDQELNS